MALLPDDAWNGLVDDLYAEFDQGHLTAAIIIDRHRAAIEAAVIVARDAEADAILDQEDVAAALRKWSYEQRVPDLELLARASAEHYEHGDGYNASRMDLASKADHHRLYCVPDAKRWHEAIAREYDRLAHLGHDHYSKGCPECEAMLSEYPDAAR